MNEEYDHLSLPRLDPTNKVRKAGSGRGKPPPADPAAHAESLEAGLKAAEAKAAGADEGFDPRLLVKLRVEGLDPEELESIPGVQVVSQEEKAIAVVFVDDGAKAEFQKRLGELKRGGKPTRTDVLFAIKGIDNWQASDREGPAIRSEGLPKEATFPLDVELWSLELGPQRQAMLTAFGAWCREHDIELVDTLNRETVVLARVRLTKAGAKALLEYRDVRAVDLAPKVQLDFDLLRLSLTELGQVPKSPDDAPRVAVLDSGLASAHPLLAPAVGDSQSFLKGREAQDESGHGTMVCGIALYGDVESCAERRKFEPKLRLLSGRITNDKNETEGLVEKQVATAVEYFVKEYKCRIFNLSIGNSRRRYMGGHLGPWASLLDELARLHGVLFVVSAGNFSGTAKVPGDWLREYPDYLLKEEARIIDPATAVNALTVGSLARHEVSRMTAKHPDDAAHKPIARADEPSSFSRTGPSIRGTIKPDVVEHGGNFFVDARTSNSHVRGRRDLGVLSTSIEFAHGRLFGVDAGTSFAAPKIAHLAGMLLAKYPNASASMLRALILAHSTVPDRARTRLASNGPKSEQETRLRRVVGYGVPDLNAASCSTERRVTLSTEAELGENLYHFYEVPLPEDFLKAPVKRPRRITVSLAHLPVVRRTRIDYLASEFSFRVVKHSDLDTVLRIFERSPPHVRQAKLPSEPGEFLPGMSLRKGGTAQAATWEISSLDKRWIGQKLFVVVERSVPSWALGKVASEPYALVVAIEDRSDVEVKLYSQIRQQVQVRERARARV